MAASRIIAALGTIVLLSGRVAAESTEAADPQPGFGVLIATIAIVIAMLIARHKRHVLQSG